VRLNVEGRGNADALEAHTSAIADLLGGTRA
jgi:phosphomannomutase